MSFCSVVRDSSSSFSLITSGGCYALDCLRVPRLLMLFCEPSTPVAWSEESPVPLPFILL